MSITVKKLIKQLKQEDPSAIVLTADHDHSYGEWNNYVSMALTFDHEDVEEDEFKLDESKNYVVIRV